MERNKALEGPCPKDRQKENGWDPLQRIPARKRDRQKLKCRDELKSASRHQIKIFWIISKSKVKTPRFFAVFIF